MTVKCIRFVSGENVVADIVDEDNESITIRDAIVAVPTNPEGTQIGFMPFAPLQDPDEHEVTVSKQFVMYVAKIAPNLKEQYNQMFKRSSILSTPEPKELIL